jgi:calcineurin-like phosphoesterase family protein
VTTTWFTSDLHFSHKMVAAKRGFVTAAIGDSVLHDENIITNWNRIVRPEDTVWVLGDVGMGHLARFETDLRRLRGRKHLITGNHDDPWPGNRDSFKYQREWLQPGLFESVQPFARRRISGASVLLSHFPYHLDHLEDPRAMQFRLRDEGQILLHGHMHDKDLRRHGHEIHVGLDAWGLAPVPLEEISRLIAEIEEESGAADPVQG